MNKMSKTDALEKVEKMNFVSPLFDENIVNAGIDPVEVIMTSVSSPINENSQVGEADVIVTKQSQLAQKWLEEGEFNRNISEANVKFLMNAMNEGDWMRINHSIGFNTGGKLSDGQHTLRAFLRSDLESIRLPITVNIEKVAMVLAMDQGKKRQLHEILTIEERRPVSSNEVSIVNAAFLASIGRLEDKIGRHSLNRMQYIEKMDYYGHRKGIIWTMDLFENVFGHIAARKKNTTIFANAFRAYEYTMDREDLTDMQKEVEVDKIKRFVGIVIGAESPIGEEWAFKTFQYFYNEYMPFKNGNRRVKSGKELAAGGVEDRKVLYGKVNRLLHYHMTDFPYNPKTKLQVATTEHFPFKEEVKGLAKRVAERKARKRERELEAQASQEKAERKRLLATLPEEERAHLEKIWRDQDSAKKKRKKKMQIAEAKRTEVDNVVENLEELEEV
jgi:hypothetical protein